MKVYHGGTSVIERPVVATGRPRLDFGQGFYVTDIKSQAESWALRMQQIRLTPGIVNVYEFDLANAQNVFTYMKFEHYDNEWLQFIVANRMGVKTLQPFDIIEGGVADDRVIDTIEAYMANMMPLENALRELSRHRPNNQICITNQDVVNSFLSFVSSYNI